MSTYDLFCAVWYCIGYEDSNMPWEPYVWPWN